MFLIAPETTYNGIEFIGSIYFNNMFCFKLINMCITQTDMAKL